ARNVAGKDVEARAGGVEDSAAFVAGDGAVAQKEVPFVMNSTTAAAAAAVADRHAVDDGVDAGVDGKDVDGECDAAADVQQRRPGAEDVHAAIDDDRRVDENGGTM